MACLSERRRELLTILGQTRIVYLKKSVVSFGSRFDDLFLFVQFDQEVSTILKNISRLACRSSIHFQEGLGVFPLTYHFLSEDEETCTSD